MFAILQMMTLYIVVTKTIFLKIDLKNVLYWFQVNSLKANPVKFQFIILGDKNNNTFVLNILEKEIKTSSEAELLDITIDNQLKLLYC